MSHHVVAIEQDFEGGIYTASLAMGTLLRRVVDRGDITTERAEDMLEEFREITVQLVKGETVSVKS